MWNAAMSLDRGMLAAYVSLKEAFDSFPRKALGVFHEKSVDLMINL